MTTTSIQAEKGLSLPTFNGVEFMIHDANGEKWIPVSQLAMALGYNRGDRLGEVIRRHQDEFLGKTTTLNLRGVKNQVVTIINYHGCIRASMLSNAPRAKEFRDWAETVLFDVMVKGYHVRPGAELSAIDSLLAKINPLLQAQTAVLTNQHSRLNAIEARLSEAERNAAATYVPAPQDNSFWPTPTERLRRLVSSDRIPKGFNRGGAWDCWVSCRHAALRSGLLSQRDRRSLGMRPDFVIQPCPENDRFLRDSFDAWIKDRHQQNSLKLLTGGK